ncbi:related to Allantoate permease [Saccharomycodes ludwigii]|uniref:Related to Allantoate permease n=1 Tax=Saccharomycodes ludwigii TaxID=36035 RepID=A0A376B720_9ASCO|nr:hypothetical protein SCDLUD_004298 [Saccharomycodes ludwigii]KAH3899981.1 hypothetical protein SCDLUD_004298 [Saccharomycodes ludwigii]SSD60379.1 related to Allantoate permease [Saccharomycodes ludwigii]
MSDYSDDDNNYFIIRNEKVTNIESGQNNPRVLLFTKDEIDDPKCFITIISPEGKEVNITGDVDDAMDMAFIAKDLQVSFEDDKKLLRKIDIYLLPFICILYAIQFMDKVTNADAAIMGLIPDLKMHGDQFSWTGSAFYFGYLGGLFVFPPLLQSSRWFMKNVSVIVILWGMVLACHAASSVNYASFIFLRCLLGFLESAITPSFIILMCQYWKQNEQFVRMCLWFSFNGLGTILSGVLSYGLYIREYSYSMQAWKVLFVITGIITIFLGGILWFHIPDNPSKAWFLTEREKLMVVQRLRSNQQGFGNRHVKKYQVFEALSDVRTWLYFLYSVCCQIPNGGLTNFTAILLTEDFGYDIKNSLLMVLPAGVVELIGCPLLGLLCFYLSMKTLGKKTKMLGHSLVWAFIVNIIVLVATCMLAFAKDSKRARLAGTYLWYLLPLSFVCILSNISSNTLGYTKKWTVSSLNMMAYAAANIAGPQTFISKQAPNYQGAKVAMVVCSAVGCVILVVLYMLNVKENNRRDGMTKNPEGKILNIENIEFADLTDSQNPNFRYNL